MSYTIKFFRPGGETRRHTFVSQPSWRDLEDKVNSLFKIQNAPLAVSYEDPDHDIVTMSSQEELQDYFQNCYKPGHIGRLTVVDSSQSQRPNQRKDTSTFVEEFDETSEGALPTMGQTMFIEVDDGGWQRLAPIPGMFGTHEADGPTGQDAFVEVLDSDAASSKKGSDPTVSEHPPNNGIATRQLRHKGKQKASLQSVATKATSSASIIDDEFPAKPPVHVYNVPDSERSLRGSTQGGGPSGVENLMESFGTVYPVSPPQDAYKQTPRMGGFPHVGDQEPVRISTPDHLDSTHSSQSTPAHVPSLDLENPPYGPNGTGGTRTPTLEQIQPSFVHDVAILVDDLTAAFRSHPELSDGVRSILRNAVNGRYWERERDRALYATERAKAAAEETSARITQVASNIANDAERDAVRLIAEALGGVFHVIGELSGAEVNASGDGHAANHDAIPTPGLELAHPPPHHYPLSPMHGSPRHHGLPIGSVQQYAYGQALPDFAHAASHQVDQHQQSLPQGTRDVGSARSQQTEQSVPQPQRSTTWGPGSYAPHYLSAPANNYSSAVRPNVHEVKAQLEAAKAVYKAEKERFRQEKEAHRRHRHEIAKRAKESRGQLADGTIREEQIIAQLPLHASSRGEPSKPPFGSTHNKPPHALRGADTTGSNYYAPSVRTVQAVSPYISRAGPSFYPAVDPSPPVPPVPPVPIPAAESVVPRAPPPPPAPPAPLPFMQQFNPPVNTPPSSLPRPHAPQFSSNSIRSASVPGPSLWPTPPARDPSRRAHLTTLRERIMARLFDMGITSTSQPDMMDILNECSNRKDKPSDDEVLADILSAMNMRGSPSPRMPGASIPR